MVSTTPPVKLGLKILHLDSASPGTLEVGLQGVIAGHHDVSVILNGDVDPVNNVVVGGTPRGRGGV